MLKPPLLPESVLNALRTIHQRADAYATEQREMRAPNGAISIGCADIWLFQKSEVLAEFCRQIGGGLSPNDAKDHATQYGIEIGKKWNTQGYKSRASFSGKHTLMITERAEGFTELDWAWRLVIDAEKEIRGKVMSAILATMTGMDGNLREYRNRKINDRNWEIVYQVDGLWHVHADCLSSPIVCRKKMAEIIFRMSHVDDWKVLDPVVQQYLEKLREQKRVESEEQARKEAAEKRDQEAKYLADRKARETIYSLAEKGRRCKIVLPIVGEQAGYLVGEHFFVHRNLDEGSPKKFVIAHLGTGMLTTSKEYVRDAIVVAWLLGRKGDWSFTNEKKAKKEDLILGSKICLRTNTDDWAEVAELCGIEIPIEES